MSQYHRMMYALASLCLLAWVAALLFRWLPWGHVLLALAMFAVMGDFLLASLEK